ncbi:MAG: branched-chain amino acid ABC transporter permease, partial [Proteobacteria bacterium]|nr:branched-chain amino acid ABC transporter permease [Pseudomonadota bacterium]
MVIDKLLEILVTGFPICAILALVSLGFNLTFGVSGIANFAYGAIYVVAGFLSWALLENVAAPLFGESAKLLLSFVTGAAAVILSALFGLVLYWTILVRLRGMILSQVIATFAVGLALIEGLQTVVLSRIQAQLPDAMDSAYLILDKPIYHQYLYICIGAVGLALFSWWFTRHTKLGLAFRAIAQDESTALTLGINSDRVAAMSVAFGAAYIALAAVLVLPSQGDIIEKHGYEVLINALAVCIVGGLGSTAGIIVAAL